MNYRGSPPQAEPYENNNILELEEIYEHNNILQQGKSRLRQICNTTASRQEQLERQISEVFGTVDATEAKLPRVFSGLDGNVCQNNIKSSIDVPNSSNINHGAVSYSADPMYTSLPANKNEFQRETPSINAWASRPKSCSKTEEFHRNINQQANTVLRLSETDNFPQSGYGVESFQDNQHCPDNYDLNPNIRSTPKVALHEANVGSPLFYAQNRWNYDLINEGGQSVKTYKRADFVCSDTESLSESTGSYDENESTESCKGSVYDNEQLIYELASDSGFHDMKGMPHPSAAFMRLLATRKNPNKQSATSNRTTLEPSRISFKYDDKQTTCSITPQASNASDSRLSEKKTKSQPNGKKMSAKLIEGNTIGNEFNEESKSGEIGTLHASKHVKAEVTPELVEKGLSISKNQQQAENDEEITATVGEIQVPNQTLFIPRLKMNNLLQNRKSGKSKNSADRVDTTTLSDDTIRKDRRHINSIFAYSAIADPHVKSKLKDTIQQTRPYKVRIGNLLKPPCTASASSDCSPRTPAASCFSQNKEDGVRSLVTSLLPAPPGKSKRTSPSLLDKSLRNTFENSMHQLVRQDQVQDRNFTSKNNEPLQNIASTKTNEVCEISGYVKCAISNDSTSDKKIADVHDGKEQPHKVPPGVIRKRKAFNGSMMNMEDSILCTEISEMSQHNNYARQISAGNVLDSSRLKDDAKIDFAKAINKLDTNRSTYRSTSSERSCNLSNFSSPSNSIFKVDKDIVSRLISPYHHNILKGKSRHLTSRTTETETTSDAKSLSLTPHETDAFTEMLFDDSRRTSMKKMWEEGAVKDDAIYGGIASLSSKILSGKEKINVNSFSQKDSQKKYVSPRKTTTELQLRPTESMERLSFSPHDTSKTTITTTGESFMQIYTTNNKTISPKDTHNMKFHVFDPLKVLKEKGEKVKSNIKDDLTDFVSFGEACMPKQTKLSHNKDNKKSRRVHNDKDENQHPCALSSLDCKLLAMEKSSKFLIDALSEQTATASSVITDALHGKSHIDILHVPTKMQNHSKVSDEVDINHSESDTGSYDNVDENDAEESDDSDYYEMKKSENTKTRLVISKEEEKARLGSEQVIVQNILDIVSGNKKKNILKELSLEKAESNLFSSMIKETHNNINKKQNYQFDESSSVNNLDKVDNVSTASTWARRNAFQPDEVISSIIDDPVACYDDPYPSKETQFFKYSDRSLSLEKRLGSQATVDMSDKNDMRKNRKQSSESLTGCELSSNLEVSVASTVKSPFTSSSITSSPFSETDHAKNHDDCNDTKGENNQECDTSKRQYHRNILDQNDITKENSYTNNNKTRKKLTGNSKIGDYCHNAADTFDGIPQSTSKSKTCKKNSKRITTGLLVKKLNKEKKVKCMYSLYAQEQRKQNKSQKVKNLIRSLTGILEEDEERYYSSADEEQSKGNTIVVPEAPMHEPKYFSSKISSAEVNTLEKNISRNEDEVHNTDSAAETSSSIFQYALPTDETVVNTEGVLNISPNSCETRLISRSMEVTDSFFKYSSVLLENNITPIFKLESTVKHICPPLSDFPNEKHEQSNAYQNAQTNMPQKFGVCALPLNATDNLASSDVIEDSSISICNSEPSADYLEDLSEYENMDKRNGEDGLCYFSVRLPRLLHKILSIDGYKNAKYREESMQLPRNKFGNIIKKKNNVCMNEAKNDSSACGLWSLVLRLFVSLKTPRNRNIFPPTENSGKAELIATSKIPAHLKMKEKINTRGLSCDTHNDSEGENKEENNIGLEKVEEDCKSNMNVRKNFVIVEEADFAVSNDSSFVQTEKNIENIYYKATIAEMNRFIGLSSRLVITTYSSVLLLLLAIAVAYCIFTTKMFVTLMFVLFMVCVYTFKETQ